MSKNIEKYLKTIFSVIENGQAATTNEISRCLGVAPSSVTHMLKNLDEKGYIKYSPYQGAIFTDAGLKFGEKITRKHRLLECFLHDSLKLDKGTVHDQACEMDHALSDEAERALCRVLKHPNRCPDDKKVIPLCDLEFTSCEECQKLAGDSLEKVGKRKAGLVAVSSLKEREGGRVAFIRGDNKLLRRLSLLGLTSGAAMETLRSNSLKSSVEVSVGDSRTNLDRDTASGVFVEKILEREKIKPVQEPLSTINRRLEERYRQNKIMNEMRELLQACSTVKEIPPIITIFVTKLFPNTGGALFLMNDSRTYLQSVARWGDLKEYSDENVFEPDACWGLRRGRIHEVEDIKAGPICPHLKHQIMTPYMCLPLIAKGDILGLLHMRIKPFSSGEDSWNNIADLKEPVVTFAEYLSLSIANIRLWEKLTDQSIRDPLTGLFNRRYMEDTIQREILRASRDQTRIGIIMADIDHFKNFNDKYGHEAGDELLIKLADFFKFEIRGSDIACRYGGEEYVLILPDSTATGAYERAEHIRNKVKDLKVYYREQLLPAVTLSMGVAIYPDHGNDLNDLIHAADVALYQAKGQGRDRVISS